MHLNNIPITKTLKICEPLFLKQSKTGILILHGYTGCPYSYRNLINLLIDEDYSLNVPRYPGHGTSGEDFLGTTWKDWLRRSIDAYYDLAGICNEIYVIGFSMGGAISLILSSYLKPKKIILISPATELFGNKIIFSKFLSIFKKKMKSGYYEKSDVEEYQFLIDEYLSYFWPSQANSLLKLSRMAKKKVKEITSDTLILAGKKDDIVPYSASEYIYNNIKSKNKNLKIYPNSGHDLLNEVEKDEVIKDIMDFLHDDYSN